MPVISRELFNLLSTSISFSHDITFPKYLKEFTCSMILLSITVLILIGSRPLSAIGFVFCTDTVKPYSVIMRFNLWTAFCRLYSVLDVMT
jgi:hypothetical protein